ncbi:nicotinate-nucleotide--dimethylbenzimidazole phosphoribosyltransferase [bacterium]|nr:MAG: nicotinate-nucleotide--dimethylbenzimidazole phosphoribosyltransferase [bacterium]
MDSKDRFDRPGLPAGFDDSRARERRDDPTGWRFDDDDLAAVMRVIAERRDIRRFRPDPIPDQLLRRLLEAAHQAPSVGLMQPWRFILVRSEETKAAMQAIAARERLVQSEHFDERARQYLDLKIEGIREAPLSICVCCDRDSGRGEVLGRHTIRDTDLYSTCLAIQNFWLAARAGGVGVGWVSFYRPDDVSALLHLPPSVVPVAWLCVGYPDERPSRPGLEAAGWERRRALEGFVFSEGWGEPEPSALNGAQVVAGPSRDLPELPEWWSAFAAPVVPGDAAAAIRIRDASDELVKPMGSLGGLETLVERWAMATGAPPPINPRVGILVVAADHGVARHSVSLYPARVGGQVAQAAARGETAIGVLARALGAELVVADVGLTGADRPGVLDHRVAAGSADITLGPAMTPQELRAGVAAGYSLASALAERSDVIVVGEIGIGNTTVAAALLAALTGLSPEAVCGRGTGLDAQGLERKRAIVAAALRVNSVNRADPLESLRRLGGHEFAALVGAMLAAAASRRPVLLDGFATGVAALVACRLQPAVRDYLIAGHRSAEPAHALVLTELGLEPLLDLRLRLGEASGAALALPLIGLAARLHAEMGRFDETGVERAPAQPSSS